MKIYLNPNRGGGGSVDPEKVREIVQEEIQPLVEKVDTLETFVELTQAEYDALEEYADNTTYIITDAPEADFATKEYVDYLIGEINNRLANI